MMFNVPTSIDHNTSEILASYLNVAVTLRTCSG